MSSRMKKTEQNRLEYLCWMIYSVWAQYTTLESTYCEIKHIYSNTMQEKYQRNECKEMD